MPGGGDGYIYFAPTNGGGIWRVPEAGGPAVEVTRKDVAAGEISHRWPHVIAGTNTLLFGMWTGPGDDEHAVAFQTIGEAGHHVLVGGEAPRYAAKPGMLLYSQSGQLFAVPWRPAQKDVSQAVPVAMPEHTPRLGESAGNFAVSTDGALAYVAGGRTRNAARLVFIDRAGKIEVPPLPERKQELSLGRREGLSRASVVNLDNVHVVPQALLGDRIGTLAASREREVKRALGYALDWPELKLL